MSDHSECLSKIQDILGQLWWTRKEMNRYKQALEKICKFDLRFTTPLSEDQSAILEELFRQQRNIRDEALSEQGERDA